MPPTPSANTRQRAAISCDWCKQKRSRCIKPVPNAPCTNCMANQVNCETKHHRKQRVYGSVESLSQRYRALDALVAGLFPTDDTKSLDGLYAIAAERGIQLGSREDQTAEQDAFAPSSYEASKDPPIDSLVDEKLVPTPSGIGHYVGPSSSFRFVNAIRSIVRYHTDFQGISALRDDFATFRSSIVLERGQGVDRAVPPFTPPSPRPEGSNLDALLRFPPLPPSALTDSIVTAFFDQLHHCYPLFLRPIFQLEYEAFSASPLSTQTDLGWLCCLAMIIVFGAEMVGADERLRSQYVDFVRTSLGQLVGTASLVNVQALLLLQLYEHNSGQRNAAWIFLGCASRMGIALGLHLDSANKACPDVNERTTRTKVWWTMYNFERLLCLMLGRPSSIDDGEITVPLPDSTFDNGDLPLRFVEFQMRLGKLQGSIRQSEFHPPEQSGNPASGPARSLLAHLQTWVQDLPVHLQPTWRSMAPQHRRANVLLHLYHQHLVLLATRPFLLHRCQMFLAQRTVHQDTETLALTCLESAETIVQYCLKLAEEELLDTLAWLDVYFVYLAVLVLSLNRLVTPRNDHSVQQNNIGTIFSHLRRRRLAPTYRHLIKISHQLALLSGALVEESDDHALLARPADDPPGNVDNNVFADWLVESLTHDTFDMGAYGVHGSSGYAPTQTSIDLQTLFGSVAGSNDLQFHSMGTA